MWENMKKEGDTLNLQNEHKGESVKQSGCSATHPKKTTTKKKQNQQNTLSHNTGGEGHPRVTTWWDATGTVKE